MVNKERFKFRAWDTSKKIMFYDVQDTYDFNYTHQDNEELTPAEHFGQLLAEENIIVEQCTGLKDKKGKLIYEGDIIKDLTFNEEEQLAIIKFGNSDDFDGNYQCFYPEWLGEYSKRTKYSMGWRRGLVWWCNSGIKVVGNIHENHELLER